MKLGFIGLGIMGAPMAGHLRAAGHDLVVNTRSKAPQALLDAGAVACASPADVAAKADVIFTMVPDTPDVQKVLFGDGGVAQALADGKGKGKTVIDMSSIAPIETQDFARRIEASGADWLDAPVSGGEVGAKAASLTAPPGLRAHAAAAHADGQEHHHVGPAGAGQITKVANQVITSLKAGAHPPPPRLAPGHFWPRLPVSHAGVGGARRDRNGVARAQGQRGGPAPAQAEETVVALSASYCRVRPRRRTARDARRAAGSSAPCPSGCAAIRFRRRRVWAP